MIKIVSASHYLQLVNDDAALTSLESALKDLCREPFRRIDRFIQLALLGSANCAAGRKLRPDCGIYLGSGLGPVGNNIVTQEQLIRDSEIPKPFNFINTLGSSAGFYVARNLGLQGQNFFISRRGASLQAVLSAAMADMFLGFVTQALVGVVEEVALPLGAHRLRQHLPQDILLAEGSHWLLLQSGAGDSRSLDLQRFAEFTALEDFLKSAWRTGDRLCCTRSMETHAAKMMQRGFDADALSGPTSAFHDSLEAAWLAAFAAGSGPGNLFLVDGHRQRGWSLFHLGA
ncbi:MAG: hypothetical protein ACYDCJ_10665 [Gammaproteobacteria bacterium]